MENNKEQLNRIENNIDSLVVTFRTSRLQFIYYFLTLAVACIGFSVSLTTDLSYSWSLMPLGLAIILWGYSFAGGLNEIFNLEQVTENNRLLLEAIRDDKPTDKLLIDIDIATKNIPRFHKAQMISFLLGVLLFLCWALLKMYQS